MKDDEQFIYQIVEQLEAAWNAGDSVAFCANFAEDIDFIDILGNHHTGRSVVEAGHRHIFATFYKGSQQYYTVESIRFIRPDAAIAFVRARLLSRLTVAADCAERSDHTGETLQEDHARPTLILSKDGERWQVVAFQNTRIAEAASVNSPSEASRS